MTAWETAISSLSPVVWYKFDGTGTPTDFGSAATTATAGGTTPTASQPGLSGSSYRFTAGRYNLSAFPSNTLDDKTFTVEAVFRFDEQTSQTFPTIFRADAPSGSACFIMRSIGSGSNSSTGKMETYFSTSNGAYILQYSAGRVDDGMWHHAAIIANGTTIRLLLDGYQEWIVNVPSGSVNLDASGTKAIGYGGSGEQLIGNIDEFVIHNSALTNAQIFDNIKGVLPTRAELAKLSSYSTRPPIYFPLDENLSDQYLYNIGNISNTQKTTLSNSKTSPTGGVNGNYLSIGSYGGYNSACSWGATNNHTFSFWIKKASAPSSNQDWLYWYYDSYTKIDSTRAKITTDGKLHFNPVFGGTYGSDLVTSSSICDGNFHHIAITRNQSTLKLYVDGTLVQTATDHGSGSGGSANNLQFGSANTSFDEFIIENTTWDQATVSLFYNAGVSSVPVSYTAVPATATALAVDPVVSTTKSVNYSAAAMTATALAVDPVVSTTKSVNYSAAAMTATALAVDPVVSTTRTVNYSAAPMTASAIAVNPIISVTQIVNYSAAPATASALLSSNVFFGKTIQDTNYNLDVRQIYTSNSNNNDANNGSAYVGVQFGVAGAVASRSSLALKATSGVPSANEIVKFKFDPANVTVSSYQSGGDGLYINVYVFTSSPASGTFTTMSYANMGTKELLYTARYNDDGAPYVDLTAAFADARAATYGVLLEANEFFSNTVTPATDLYQRLEITGSNKSTTGFYILTSNFVNKNVNADIATATALFVNPAVAVTTNINYSAVPATASALAVQPINSVNESNAVDPMTATALAVNPTVTIISTINYSAAAATASALLVMPVITAVRSNTYVADVATATASAPNSTVNVSESNAVVPMTASALLPNAQVVLDRTYTAQVMLASITSVNATAQPILNGLVFAGPMTANAISVVPPAYKTLFSDKWYSLLYSQHAQKHNFRTTNGGNGEAILKLFDDVTANKAAGTSLSNNLTHTIVSDGIIVDEGAPPVMPITAEFNPPENTPVLEKGYFDAFERKAVRLNNISTGYEGSEFITTGFTFELSIKTTKSDQILAYGKSRYFYGYQQTATTYGISDGKLFFNATGAIGPAPLWHYKEGGNSIIGNKRIDDGQWHHIVIQRGWDDNRIQFWIDGDLDKQKIGGYNLDGPSFLGFNAFSSTYASDFYTSAWSYDSHAFIKEYDIDAHRYAYIKYNPVLASPMTANAFSTDAVAGSNKGRALLLYWWPTDEFQNIPLNTKKFNQGSFPVDVDTFDSQLTTIDVNKSAPQDYYGWDIFPVDITGYYVSELVKPEAYGGANHIKNGSKPFIGTGQNYNSNPEYKYNDQGSFKDPVTDASRYIDLVNDIDLRNFDAIFFKNFPDDVAEMESYTRNEDVDTFFGVKEKKLYEDFLISLRAAVDTGVSLYVTNPMLAVDLGIVDRIEKVPDMDDLVGYDSDPYSPTVVLAGSTYPVNTGLTANGWADTYKNNRLRIVNLVEGLTNELDYIYKDVAIYINDDAVNYGGPNRPYHSLGYRPNGLQVGDEIIHANYIPKYGKNNYLAVPFANVKAGTIVTAFANTVRRGLDLIDNPYKNYATSIVVNPGDVLAGKQSGGRIFVNFTETINGAYDERDVDLISDFWINRAYAEGSITLAEQTVYLAASYNIDRQLANNTINQTQYDQLFYWSSNGSYVLGQGNILQDEEKQLTGKANKVNNKIRKINKNGGLSYNSVPAGGQFFSFSYSYEFPRVAFDTPSIPTLGFRWLSNRSSYLGIINRPLALTATALLPMPVVVAQKSTVVNAQSMLATAYTSNPSNVVAKNINIAALPMEAFAVINQYVTRISAAPMIASAILRTNIVASTTSVDQVVLYIMHTDPILYLREDVIK